MEENLILTFDVEEVEFDEELFKKNIEENDFSGCEDDGIGIDKDGDDEDATN